MTSPDHTAEPTAELDPLVLFERLGVGKVAQAFGISEQAVRRYRVKGVPKRRLPALIELARTEGVLAPDEDVAPTGDQVAGSVAQPAGKVSPAAQKVSKLAKQVSPAPKSVAQPTAEVSPASEKVSEPSGRVSESKHQPQWRPMNRPPPSGRPAGGASAGQGHTKPVRLNRQTVLIVGVGLVAALALGLTQGLRSLGSTTTSDVREAERHVVYQPQGANALPTYSYADLPQTAASPVAPEPPEVADPPKPVVTEPSATPVISALGFDRRAQEEEEALRSPLFPAGALALRSQVQAAAQQRSQLSPRDQFATSLSSPQDLFPGNQPSAAEQREAFLNRQPDQRIYLQNGLQRPFSDYEVKAGTIIPAALITGLNSDLPGEIIGQVTEHVYDTATGQHLLIPQGARIFGRYNSQVGYAQDRVQVVWDRLIMPNGNSVQLEAMVGTDKAGFAGLTDQVDHHLGRLFGAVILSSIISSGANLATDGGGDNGFTDSLGNAAAQQAVTIGSKLVDRQLDVQPTITVRPGFKLNILVNKDMILEPYGRGSRRF
jgi:type IV secretion system protein VirB10